MRLIAYIAAIMVLFALADPSAAQIRYSVAETSGAPSISAKAAGLRLLTWPGKVVPQSSSARLTSTPRSYPSYAPVRWSPTPPAAPLPPPQTPMAAEPLALPASIYAPPAAPARNADPAPVRALAMAAPASGDPPASVRFYSLHRQYGDTPDPIPLTPQFFSDSTPDLAQPPPPVARPATTANGRVLQPVPADPDSAGPAGT